MVDGVGFLGRKDSMSLHEIPDESLYTRPDPFPLSYWDKFKRGASVFWGGALGAASLATRILNLGPWPNALSSFSLGIATQYCVETSIPDTWSLSRVSRVRNLSMTMFGGVMTLFADVLRWPDDPPTEEQAAASTLITVALGVNCYLLFKTLYKNRGVRTESSQPLITPDGPRFRVFCEGWPKHLLRIAIGAGATTYAILTEDPVERALSGMAATYFASQIPGDWLMDCIDQKIDQGDRAEQTATLTQTTGSRWRTVKVCILTTGAIGIPIALIPFVGKAHTAERINQLIGTGAVIGFFDAAQHQAFENRLRNTPIQQIHELKQDDSPLYRTWSVVAPSLATVGIFGVTLWQMGWELDSPTDRGMMGALLSGFVATTLLTHLIDRSWDADARIKQEETMQNYCNKAGPRTLQEHLDAWKTRLKDKLAIVFLLTKRFCGIPPIYAYGAITNAVKMNDQSHQYPALVVAGYALYGSALALELYGTSGRRRGVGYQFVLVAMVNGALTFERVATGEVL